MKRANHPSSRAKQQQQLWGLFVDGAMRYPWVWLTPGNPANVPLYMRHGFKVLGSFTLPEGGPEVFTMWREARQ